MNDADFRKRIEHALAPRTVRIYERDLQYFWAWARIAMGCEIEMYPVPSEWLIEYVLDHTRGLSPERLQALQDLGQRTTDRPLSIKTLTRHLVPLSNEHAMRGVAGAFTHPKFKLLKRRLMYSAQNVRIKTLPITTEILIKLINVCGVDPRGQRDRAILMVGFAGGGRRRSELSAMCIEHLTQAPGGYVARLPNHKTAGRTQEALVFPIFDDAAVQLDRWLNVAGIQSGPVFRGIHRSGRILSKLGPNTILRIIKELADRAGLPSRLYGAHSLRSGFVTEAARRRIPLTEAMAISNHRSYDVAIGYYRPGRLADNPAAHMSTGLQGLAGFDQTGLYLQDH